MKIDAKPVIKRSDRKDVAKVQLFVTKAFEIGISKQKMQILKMELQEMSLLCLLRSDETADIKG